MAQIKYSQKSIVGLEAALLALNTAVTNAGTGGASALIDAINTEVAARNGAISTAIATEVTNRNTAIDAAIATVIGSAPAAFDTLKEIADYITVNPNATVADAITAAVATVQANVDALSGVVSAEQTYLDNLFASTIRKTTTENLVLAEINSIDSLAGILPTFAIDTVLNHGDARFTNALTGVTYELPVVLGEGVFVDFTGYETEVGAVVGLTVKIQYTYAPDLAALRLSNGL